MVLRGCAFPKRDNASVTFGWVYSRLTGLVCSLVARNFRPDVADNAQISACHRVKHAQFLPLASDTEYPARDCDKDTASLPNIYDVAAGDVIANLGCRSLSTIR